TDLTMFLQTARTMLSTKDIWMAFKILSLAYGRFINPDQWQELVNSARRCHGERVDYLLPSLEEEERQSFIVARREMVYEADYRFFLALLLNVPNRGAIYRLAQERFPMSDPEDLILGWITALSERKLLGLDLGHMSKEVLKLAFQRAGRNGNGQTVL